MIFLDFSETWIPIHDGNLFAKKLFKKHYSYYHYKDNRDRKKFIGPGEYIALITPKLDALFVWRKFISMDKQNGINCAIFRNEGSTRSSDLILAAEDWAIRKWEKQRFYTYVNPQKIKSINPGCCFKKAGWKSCGITKKRKLIILEKLP